MKEVRQRKQVLYDITYMWNQKTQYKLTCLQNRNGLTDIEINIWLPRRKRERNKLGVWD